MIDPLAHPSHINVMAFGDWGPSYATGFTPIHETVRNLMLKKRMNLLVLTGDIAYNLNSRNGTNYI